jgi:hypothetical protein
MMNKINYENVAMSCRQEILTKKDEKTRHKMHKIGLGYIWLSRQARDLKLHAKLLTLCAMMYKEVTYTGNEWKEIQKFHIRIQSKSGEQNCLCTVVI